MRLNIRARITSLLGESSLSSDRLSSDTSESVSSSLYACQSCNTTYVAAELCSCPECGDAVEDVPTASELGFNSADKL